MAGVGAPGVAAFREPSPPSACCPTMPRPTSTTVAIRLSIIAAVTVAGGLWLHHTGPHPVIRGMTVTDEYAPLWYMLTALPVLGVLVADVVDAIRSRVYRESVVLAVATVAIVGLSAGRLSLFLPISGHALVVTFVVVLRVARRSGPKALLELVVSVGLLAVITYMKLVVWRDPITLGVGVGIGVLFAVVTLLAIRWRACPSP